ncbi:MAG: PIN domain-containing protein [Deltaproteobacteria bacterium]|nr:PIN domain-containing protein [Deltaproteobacteria bacterium]
MTYALDTNVFLYAHFPDYDSHTAVRQYLSELIASGQNIYLSWQVVYEYLRITTHPRVFAKPLTFKKALQSIKPYWELPQCSVLSESSIHGSLLEKMPKEIPSAKGNFLHDLRYATLLQEHGIKNIVTCDLDFKKFDFLKVINPVTKHFG